MQSYTHAVLMGNLTRDPAVRFTSKGAAVASLAVAVNRRYRKSGGGEQGGEIVEEVSFFDVDVFGKQAELCNERLHKGDPVLLEGRLKQDRYQAKDGTKRSSVKVVANQVCFLTRPHADGHAADAAPAASRAAAGKKSGRKNVRSRLPEGGTSDEHEQEPAELLEHASA